MKTGLKVPERQDSQRCGNPGRRGAVAPPGDDAEGKVWSQKPEGQKVEERPLRTPFIFLYQ